MDEVRTVVTASGATVRIHFGERTQAQVQEAFEKAAVRFYMAAQKEKAQKDA